MGGQKFFDLVAARLVRKVVHFGDDIRLVQKHHISQAWIKLAPDIALDHHAALSCSRSEVQAVLIITQCLHLSNRGDAHALMFLRFNQGETKIILREISGQAEIAMERGGMHREGIQYLRALHVNTCFEGNGVRKLAAPLISERSGRLPWGYVTCTTCFLPGGAV